MNELITIDRFHDFSSPTRWNNNKLEEPVKIFRMIKILVKIFQSFLLDELYSSGC